MCGIIHVSKVQLLLRILTLHALAVDALQGLQEMRRHLTAEGLGHLI